MALPHQIRAVYGDLLPRTPLRFLLADDPGAGKTIMAGLYIKELLLALERSDWDVTIDDFAVSAVWFTWHEMWFRTPM